MGEQKRAAVSSAALWLPLQRVAAVGGLILDWRCWHRPGLTPAAPDHIQALGQLLARAEVDRSPAFPWDGVPVQVYTTRRAVGLPCQAWPLEQGRFVYAAAHIRVATALDAALRLGSYVGFRLWQDGRLLAQAAPGPAFALDDNRFPLRLASGRHVLLVEIDREQWRTVFHARLSAPDGRDLPDGAVGVASLATAPSDGAAAAPIPPAFAFYNAQLNEPGQCSLDGVGEGGWPAWRATFGARYRELLALPTAALSAVVVTERRPWHGLTLERVVLHGGPSGPVPLSCLLPPERRVPPPGLLCLHGHGAGKDDVVGKSAEDPAQRARVEDANYAYALHLARRGYVVLAPDLRAFGERQDPGQGRRGRDQCDNNFMKAAMLGATPLALDLADLQLVISYALTRPELDPDRFGCVGLSLGGRMSMYLAALDERIRAVVVSGALNSLKERLTTYAACGSQLLPGLWRYGDTPEVFGLIAPRPLLLELGTQDGTSPEVYAAETYRRIQHAYALAGATDRLDLDVFARGHRFNGTKAIPFLAHWLELST